MERDQISIDDLIQRLLNFDSIDCRICLRMQDEDWHLTHIIGDVNKPDFIKSEWVNTYLDVAFIRDMIATTELSSWLANLRGELRTFAFQIRSFMRTCNRRDIQRRSLRSTFITYRIPSRSIRYQHGITTK